MAHAGKYSDTDRSDILAIAAECDSVTTTARIWNARNGTADPSHPMHMTISLAQHYVEVARRLRGENYDAYAKLLAPLIAGYGNKAARVAVLSRWLGAVVADVGNSTPTFDDVLKLSKLTKEIREETEGWSLPLAGGESAAVLLVRTLRGEPAPWLTDGGGDVVEGSVVGEGDGVGGSVVGDAD